MVNRKLPLYGGALVLGAVAPVFRADGGGMGASGGAPPPDLP